ncbi:hypothetical protein [Flavobacterium granuli]|uniref:Uncharacterized protein n=1 Tax=Flavobacterium granuli TaxID=280093 RepID=A0A1M5NKG2_9FLAO|nr:hypothetical protein [Flavobacterium granuli]PRZ23314.1 hypothetical protein BC624_10536 [Flavobacterium granuli]SHG89992.1 hypothetical protein SAMN05443373_10536 [Flavobacterium granuli]
MTFLFRKTFNTHILKQKVISWGFQNKTRVFLPNGAYAFPAGYFAEYKMGIK